MRLPVPFQYTQQGDEGYRPGCKSSYGTLFVKRTYNDKYAVSSKEYHEDKISTRRRILRISKKFCLKTLREMKVLIEKLSMRL